MDSQVRSASGSAKPVWTLRCRSSDGTIHDHFETTRFKRKRTFDILNLTPGTYDLFVGVRRDVFFFENEDSTHRKNGEELAGAGPIIAERKRSIDDESDEEPSVEGEDDSSTSKPDRSVLKHFRAGLGAAFSGGRKVISTVTLGKVGTLGIVLDILILDCDGNEIVATAEQLICGDKANFELRFILKDHESCVKLRIRSLSTLHTMHVFSSIFQVVHETTLEVKQLTKHGHSKSFNPSPKSQVQASPPLNGTDYDQPTQMLRRALTGSRHPERSAFARALAFACFSSFCGFTIGYTLEASTSLPLAGFAFLAWIMRAFVHLIVISTQWL